MRSKGMDILSMLHKKNFLPDIASMNLTTCVDCLALENNTELLFTHFHLLEGRIHLIVFILVCALWMLGHLVVRNILLPLSMIILERYGLLC